MALNGRLPDSMLAYLGWPEVDHLRLVPAAAASLNRLASAFEAKFSKPLYLSDAYRTFATQVALKATKGKFAATPGKSNHGLGIAIDVASRVNVDGSAEHRWFEANAPAYGWINPYWAEDYNPGNGEHEPWHWEFTGTPNIIPVSPTKEDDMPLNQADLEAIDRIIAGRIDERLRHPGEWGAVLSQLGLEAVDRVVAGRTQTLAKDIAAALPAAGAIDTAALVAAIVKALPVGSGGGLTPAQVAAVTAAVKAGLTTLILRATV